MACCTVEGIDKTFSEQANRYARKFRKRGLDKAQRLIMGRLERFGLEGKSVVEIGCGVGGLHLSLLKKGGSSAIGVEVSGGMIAKARELACELGVAEKVEYVEGDFVFNSKGIRLSDMVVLDKVLCCYADPKVLIERSAAKANMVYAVSYPRDAWMVRLAFSSIQRFGTLLGWSFHPFYHEPADLDAVIEDQGMEEIDSGLTPVWQVKIFKRKTDARDGPNEPGGAESNPVFAL